jgi:hypothetical protein
VNISKFANSKLVGILGFTSILFITGCQTVPYQPYAREVKKKPGVSGLIALKPEFRDEDRAKAQSIMASNCSGSIVNVLEEGEVVVGTKNVANSREVQNEKKSGMQVGSLFGIPVHSEGEKASQDTASTTETTSIKEWNISYECQKSVAEGPRKGVKK